MLVRQVPPPENINEDDRTDATIMMENCEPFPNCQKCKLGKAEGCQGDEQCQHHRVVRYTVTGLGLWVVKEIVNRHGGTIEVHSGCSDNASGTAFDVLLPIAENSSNLRLI